jgi:hypothetical protein
MQTSIRFIRPAGSVHGSFAAGDVLRCSVEFAAHFVGLGAAEYRRAPLPVGPVQPEPVRSEPVQPSQPSQPPAGKRQRKSAAVVPS